MIPIIRKFVSTINGTLENVDNNGIVIYFATPFKIKVGYTYYIFITEQKAWIRHSGKLTKEEKQWVIESENKKHICFEASHIECSCQDKCLRNINNYK